VPQIDLSRIATYRTRFADSVLQHEIEQFFCLEAELLDDRKLDEWLALIASDVNYAIQSAQARGGADDARSEWSKPQLEALVQSWSASGSGTGKAPVSTRRTVANVRIKPGDGPDSFKVRSNILQLSVGTDGLGPLVSATRLDVLLRVGTDVGFELARRWVFMDAPALNLVSLGALF